MAFNWQTFRTRTLTAILFAVVMITGLLWSNWSFLLLFSIIHFGCWWEYLQLGEKIHGTRFHPYSKLGFMLVGYGFVLWMCNPTYQVAGYSLADNLSLPVLAAGFALLAIGIFQPNRVKTKAYGFAAAGLLYISLCWGLMMGLYDYQVKESVTVVPHPGDAMRWYMPVFSKPYTLPLLIISSIWINDTMAYIVGSIIGKTPLSRISPKKTWEGTLGGMLLSIVVTGLGFSYFTSSLVTPQYFDQFSEATWYIIAAICAIAGTFGDLFESKLKRMADVKDSGRFMPGHGGFLDRFDSLLFAVFFVWLYVTLVGA